MDLDKFHKPTNAITTLATGDYKPATHFLTFIAPVPL